MYLNKSLPITIASGHAGNAGATGYGYKEEVLTKELVKIICDKFKKLGFDIRDVSPTGNYTVSQQLVEEYTNANKITNAQLHICIHFNASNGQGHGTETWIYALNNKANEYATAINTAICNVLDTTNRGVKASGNSLAIPRRVNAPVCLIETVFIDNQSDINKYIPNKENVADAIVEALTGIKLSPQPTTEITNKKEEMNYSMYVFSKNWYLKKYSDVSNSAVYKEDPYAHYEKHGKNEGRQPLPPIPSEYNEGAYLELNPDVAEAVKKGTYTSGLHHYLCYGFNEPRKICKDETDESMKKRIEELEVKLEEIKKIIE